MDSAVLQSQIAALHKCIANGVDSFDRWKVSGDFLEDFREGLVPDIPGSQEAWELARDVHIAAAMDVFGLHTTIIHKLYPSPFASPVSAPVSMPPQPAEIAKLQPAEVALPPHSADEFLHQPPAVAEVILPPHSADEFLHQPPAVAKVILPTAEAKSHAKLQAKSHAKLHAKSKAKLHTKSKAKPHAKKDMYKVIFCDCHSLRF